MSIEIKTFEGDSLKDLTSLVNEECRQLFNKDKFVTEVKIQPFAGHFAVWYFATIVFNDYKPTNK